MKTRIRASDVKPGDRVYDKEGMALDVVSNEPKVSFPFKLSAEITFRVVATGELLTQRIGARRWVDKEEPGKRTNGRTRKVTGEAKHSKRVRATRKKMGAGG